MSQLSVFLQRTITVLLWLGGSVVFFKWLLAPLLPFLLALALSAMVEPSVQKLRRWMRVRRSFAAGVVTTALLLVLGGGLVLLAARLAMECGFRETWVLTDAGFQAVGLEDFLAEAEAPRRPLGRLLRSL